MRRFLAKWIVRLGALILLILAAANRDPVILWLWPFGVSVEIPIFGVLFAGICIGAVLPALMGRKRAGPTLFRAFLNFAKRAEPKAEPKAESKTESPKPQNPETESPRNDPS